MTAVLDLIRKLTGTSSACLIPNKSAGKTLGSISDPMEPCSEDIPTVPPETVPMTRSPPTAFHTTQQGAPTLSCLQSVARS